MRRLSEHLRGEVVEETVATSWNWSTNFDRNGKQALEVLLLVVACCRKFVLKRGAAVTSCSFLGCKSEGEQMVLGQNDDGERDRVHPET